MQLRLLPGEVHTAERVYIARLDDLGHWPEEIDLQSRYFTLLLAMDAREIDDGVVTSFAERLLHQGLSAVDVFGPDCERVENLFDIATVDRDLREGVEHPLVPTGALGEEDIDEALWQATFVLWPVDEYLDGVKPVLLVAVVGNPGWADHLEARLADFDGFSREMDERNSA